MERRPREIEERLEEERRKKTEELEIISRELEKEYEDRVRRALAQLREVHTDQLKQKAQGFDKQFEKKVTQLQTAVSSTRAQHCSDLEELEDGRRRLQGLEGRSRQLDEANLGLEGRMGGLARELVDRAGQDAKEVGRGRDK